MRYSIDVLYVDDNNNIIATNEKMKLNKIGKRVKNTKSVVELPVGKIKDLNINAGDVIVFK